MTEKMIERLKKAYRVNQRDAGEFQKMKVKGMTFTVQCFTAEGLGNVSVMKASGMFGLMKMDTVVVNPFDVDAPLFSYDRIKVVKNDLLYLELFDTTIGHTFDTAGLLAVADRHTDIPDHIPTPNWYEHLILPSSSYKKTKQANSAKVDVFVEEFFDAYLAQVSQTKGCDPMQKKQCASIYSDGLIQNGGPSTDVFVKKFGKDKTREFFKKVLFGA